MVSTVVSRGLEKVSRKLLKFKVEKDETLRETSKDVDNNEVQVVP